MKPTPFTELLDGCTPGPWRLTPGYRNQVACVYLRGQNGWFIGNIVSDERGKADADYITRANPAVMRKVWEALKQDAAAFEDFATEADDTLVKQLSRGHAKRARTALRLLNGEEGV